MALTLLALVDLALLILVVMAWSLVEPVLVLVLAAGVAVAVCGAALCWWYSRCSRGRRGGL